MRRLRFFSHNRWNLFGFLDRDHGARDGTPLRPWLEGCLAAAGLDDRVAQAGEDGAHEPPDVLGEGVRDAGV